MGNELFKKVTDATGLPEDLIARELTSVLEDKGMNKNDVTLDELRTVLADYLREVILHAKNKFENGIAIEEEDDPETLGQDEA